MKGVDIYIVSKLLGHESLETTAKYLGLRPEAEREAVNRLLKPEEKEYSETGRLSLAESKDRDVKPPAGNERYEAGVSHRETIHRLSHTFAGSLKLPSAVDKDLWRKIPIEFKPGTYHLPIGQVDVTEDREIKVTLPEIGDGIEKLHMVRSLLSHLSTSGNTRFSDLAGINGELEMLRMKAGHYSELLVNLYRSLVDSFAGAGTPVHKVHEQKPGLTKDFFITAWVDIIQRTQGSKFIYAGWYKPPEVIPGTGLFKLRCGAFDLCIAEDARTLGIYEKQHKDLREKYAKSPLAETLSIEWQQLEILIQNIRQKLQEFSARMELLGCCNLCSENTETQ